MVSLKFVPNVPTNNIPSLVQIMAWRRSGDKPLSEPIMVSILTHICVTRPQWVNTLAPGRYVSKSLSVIFKLILMIDGSCISGEITIGRMSLVFTTNTPTLVKEMSWCRQATSHYLGQCWPRSMSTYGVTRPQWIGGKAWMKTWMNEWTDRRKNKWTNEKAKEWFNQLVKNTVFCIRIISSVS